MLENLRVHKYQQKSILFLMIIIFMHCQKILPAYIKNKYNNFFIIVMLSIINTRSNTFHKLKPELVNPKTLTT